MSDSDETFDEIAEALGATIDRIAADPKSGEPVTADDVPEEILEEVFTGGCFMQHVGEDEGVPCEGTIAVYIKPKLIEGGYSVRANCCDRHAEWLFEQGFERQELPDDGGGLGEQTASGIYDRLQNYVQQRLDELEETGCEPEVAATQVTKDVQNLIKTTTGRDFPFEVRWVEDDRFEMVPIDS